MTADNPNGGSSSQAAVAEVSTYSYRLAEERLARLGVGFVALR